MHLPQIFVSPPQSPWLVPFSPPGTGTSQSAQWSLFVCINRDQNQGSGDGEHSEMTDQTCKHFSGTASLFPPQAVIPWSYLSFLSPGILSALSDYHEILQNETHGQFVILWRQVSRLLRELGQLAGDVYILPEIAIFSQLIWWRMRSRGLD